MSIQEKSWLYILSFTLAVTVVILLGCIMKYEKVQALHIACEMQTFEMKDQACTQLKKVLTGIVTVPFASHVW